MKLRVLGCSGGIGGDLRTTSLLIDHIFVTHSHMDHVGSIPFIVDTVGWMRNRPLTVHATEETLAILKSHLFNWKLWPDFSQIPDAQNPVMRFEPVKVGGAVALNGRKVTPLRPRP